MLNTVCWVLYLLSSIAVVLISFKVTEIRSKCTHEKAMITRIVGEIRDLKEENNRLNIIYYSNLNPKSVDLNSKDMKPLAENEVKYLK